MTLIELNLRKAKELIIYQYRCHAPLCKVYLLCNCSQIHPMCSYSYIHHIGRQFLPCIHPHLQIPNYIYIEKMPLFVNKLSR